MRYAGLLFSVLLCSFTPLAAQTRNIRSVSGDGAGQALAAARAEATKRGWSMSIAVVDPAGDLIGFHRMDGASPASIDNALGKARTSARFRRPTQVYDSLVTHGRQGLMNFENMTPLEGGVPIVVDGVVVGAIGVSGGASAEDAVVAQAGAAAVKP
jgi:glc operon protein GlcG